MMFRRKIAAVSYLNTIPMIYGIEHMQTLCAELLLSPPNHCAELFKSGEVDIALLPIAALAELSDYKIITSYCIGASNPVRSVVIISDSPIQECQRIWLDSHSRTSAMLTKILCRKLWKIDPEFVELSDYSVIDRREPGDGFLLIGDKVFGYEGILTYSYDLAQQWQEMSGLPMIFAVWVAKSSVEDSFITELNSAIGVGVNKLQRSIDHYRYNDKPYAYEYLKKNIDFNFDPSKISALKLFQLETSRINPG